MQVSVSAHFSASDIDSVMILLFLILALLIEMSRSELPNINLMDEVPLSKSLGFTSKRAGRTLDDIQLGKEFKDLYKEMLKVSQEIEKRDAEEIDDTDLTRLKGLADRRRSILPSPAGKRRARSQAVRLGKLNSQSLRSHRQHSRHNINNLEIT